MTIQQVLVTVKGNDGYENSIVVKVPAAWTDIERFKAALQVAFERLGKLTIEKFISVEADLVGQLQTGETDV